jgi:hypothetical protein
MHGGKGQAILIALNICVIIALGLLGGRVLL